jgi:hypothetical protein
MTVAENKLALHTGFYKVGGKIFVDKIQAILEANKNKEDVSWDYHDDIYSKVDWLTEPPLPLTEYYRLRALQIREAYDYVIIMCSGGADSTNVLWSFLENNIMVDEVIGSSPSDGIKQYDQSSDNASKTNTVSETKFAQMPILHEVVTRFPSIKITHHEYFEDMLEYETDEWLLKSSDFIHPTTVARYRLEKHKHLKELAQAGKRIAIVYGIEKPSIITRDDGCVYSCIIDRPANVPRPAFDLDYPNVDNVLFYYAYDFPELQVKQSHVLTKWLYKPENVRAKAFMKHYPKDFGLPAKDRAYKNAYWDRAIIPCIYPDKVKKRFQAEKQLQAHWAEHDQWFYDIYKDSMLMQQLVSDYKNFIKDIDKKYLMINRTDNEIYGFETFTKTYKIGTIKQFKESAIDTVIATNITY